MLLQQPLRVGGLALASALATASSLPSTQSTTHSAVNAIHLMTPTLLAMRAPPPDLLTR